jgi:ubiquinone/menaquinone biosynthesis C-methylase UbiE
MEILQKNKQLFNKLAKRYDTPLLQFWMKRFHKPVIKELTQKKGKQKVIDLSCGTGFLLQKLDEESRPGNKFHGVDVAEKMLQIARKRNPKAKFHLADVHMLPFKDNMFDAVVSTEAFHHYSNQKKALGEMMRIAKFGGKIIVVDINFFLRPIHWLIERLEPGCVKVNSKQEMKRFFQKVGLQKIQQRRNFGFALMTVGVK